MNLINKMEKKLELLAKATWSTTDIKEYFEIQGSKALELKMQTLYRSPNLKENDNRRHKLVSPDELLKFKGTTRKKEIETIKDILSV